jgi:hypothetical protein
VSTRGGLAEAKVSAPPEKVWREILDHLRQAVPSCPAGHVPDLRLEFGERLWRDAPLAPVIRDAEPQGGAHAVDEPDNLANRVVPM